MPLPRLPLRGGKGGAVGSVIPVYPDKSGTCREPHQREAAAMAGWYTRRSAAKGGSSDGGMVHSAFSRKGIKVVCAAKLPRPLWGGGRGRGNTEQPPSTPPPLWGGGQGAGPFERLRNFLGNYFVMHFFLKKHLSSCVYQRNFVPLSPYSFRVNLENDSKTTRRRHDSISIKINHNYYGKSRF